MRRSKVRCRLITSAFLGLFLLGWRLAARLVWRLQIAALSRAPLVIVPLACKDIYLDHYAQAAGGRTGMNRAGRSLTGISILDSRRC